MKLFVLFAFADTRYLYERNEKEIIWKLSYGSLQQYLAAYLQRRIRCVYFGITGATLSQKNLPLQLNVDSIGR